MRDFMKSTDTMYIFEDLQLLFNKALSAYNTGGSPVGLYDPFTYVLGMGGKRLRPVLLLMATDAFGGEIEQAIPAALAIELFHNSTLIHDDIMDGAELRRNQPTVHKKWNSNVAILSGDLMIIKAYEVLNRLSSDRFQEVLSVFNRVTAEVCEGQQYDLDFETNDEVRISDYMSMIRLKTSVLLAGSLQMGAILGGADVEVAKKIYYFGENLGLAFQLQDDLLDAFGNEQTFGKKIGGDIVSNKKTFLLLKALDLAQGAYKDELTSLMGNKSISNQEKIDGVLRIYKALNIRSITEEHMLKYFDKALVFLNEINIPEEKKDALYQVSKKLIGRKS